MVTLKQIARELNLGVSTVSSVLHGDNPHYNAQTRQRVREAAERMGYRPNHLARAMVRGKTHTIGVMGLTTHDTVSGERLHALSDALDNAGYKMLYVSRTIGDLAVERKHLDDLLDRQVDGLLIQTDLYGDPDHYASLWQRGVPLVLSGLAPDRSTLPWVWLDNTSGLYDLTRHLLELGHRRIAYTPGQAAHLYPHHRIEGFHRALREAGVESQPRWIMDDRPSIRDNIVQFTRDMLQSTSDRPTALMYNNDEQAFAGLQVIMQMGLHVPRDVSVTGFGDLTLSKLACPALTTVTQPAAELARSGVELLMEQILAKQAMPCRQIMIPTRLTVRNSTGPAPA
ncbi:MAG: LacI family DNA-binding transcriptional regulator [Phycisphaeraceae bacterium]|nr:LacI family DNA-binding transcriptional regulator [Phycisphaeraceae bacterium]